MRAFAVAWPDEPIVQQLAAQIPWFHNCTLLDKVKDALPALEALEWAPADAVDSTQTGGVGEAEE